MFDVEIAHALLSLSQWAHSSAPDVEGLPFRESSLLAVNHEGVDADVHHSSGRGEKIFADNHDTELFVCRNTTGDIIVAFRGSETDFFGGDGTLTDWAFTNLRSSRVPYPPDPGKWPDRRWVHNGFYKAFDPVKEWLRDRVKLFWDELDGAGERRIWCTGFSLGGALAYLAALDLGFRYDPADVVLYSFGAPRVGDKSLNQLLSERTGESYIVGYRGDPVIFTPPVGPNFPVTTRLFARTGRPWELFGVGLQIGQNYRTADHIVYIDAAGKRREKYPGLFGPQGTGHINFLDHNFSRYCEALNQIGGARHCATKELTPAERAALGVATSLTVL